VQAWLILTASICRAPSRRATIVEALWSGVRFATFFVPASWVRSKERTPRHSRRSATWRSAGLAFTLVRRASQVVWIAVGVAVLLTMRPAGRSPGRRGGLVTYATRRAAAAPSIFGEIAL
jgi:hypothetical protein